jgi:signal transduction histidine kinase
MQHFQVARLAAPAAVILAQLQSLSAPAALPVSTTLFKNPALLLRALDALHRTSTYPAATSLMTMLEGLDQPWIDSLVRRSALQLALQHAAANHAFLHRHWHLSRRLSLLVASLAHASGYADVDSAACCGLLLRSGMLVLEQQHRSAYAVFTAGQWTQDAQLSAERDLLQYDHVETGKRLLESWQLDQFCVDALGYQAHPLEQILDAAPLVRLCWYANALVEKPTPELLSVSRALLGLSSDHVQALLACMQQDMANECAALGLADFPHASNGDLVHESRQKLQQLRQEITLDSMLAQHTSTRSSGIPLQTRLARVLQDVGIDPFFIVLRNGEGNTMEVCASHQVQPAPDALGFTCETGRNALSSLILQGGPGVLMSDPGLTVIDRQFLALLGGHTVLCDTVRVGNRTRALLLGMQPSGVSAYLGQPALRRFIEGMLRAELSAGGNEAGSTLLLQQRIREAVHEANNPLAIIKSYLYLLGKKPGAQSEEIHMLRGEIDRVASILAHLREPEASGSVVQRVDLNKIVTSMHRLFTGAFSADSKPMTVELQLADTQPWVLARESALKQILLNLVKNAAEAIEANGWITLSTHAQIYLNDKVYAQLSVHDNGPGIAPALMKDLFKFKTGASTKTDAYAGTGLGIVRRLIEDSGGQISCRSDSKGTAIDILLPIVD